MTLPKRCRVICCERRDSGSSSSAPAGEIKCAKSSSDSSDLAQARPGCRHGRRQRALHQGRQRQRVKFSNETHKLNLPKGGQMSRKRRRELGERGSPERRDQTGGSRPLNWRQAAVTSSAFRMADTTQMRRAPAARTSSRLSSVDAADGEPGDADIRRCPAHVFEGDGFGGRLGAGRINRPDPQIIRACSYRSQGLLRRVRAQPNPDLRRLRRIGHRS